MLRAMMESDYPLVFELWKNAPGIGLRTVDDSLNGISRFLARNSGTNFVAEEGGAIVGAILCGHDGRRGHIYHMAVADTHRRHGIGKALVEAVLEALGREGVTRVKLDSFAGNAAATAFWESMGFFRRSDLLYWNKSLNAEND